MHRLNDKKTYKGDNKTIGKSCVYVLVCHGSSLGLCLCKAIGDPQNGDLRGVGDNHPMYLVSWNEVQEFLSSLNASDKTYHYRLPTEAEWEYAARAGTKTLYSFGDGESLLSEHGLPVHITSASQVRTGRRPRAAYRWCPAAGGCHA